MQDLRERKLNEELALAKDYLKLEEGAEPYMFEVNLDPTPISVEGVASVHQDVRQYVREVLRPIAYGVRPSAEPANVAELKGSGLIASLKFRVDEFLRSGGVGVRSGHFRLRTGWHTDKYVSCRELCSDAGFVADLSRELAKAYEGYRLTEIVAVGTSAIPIASMLAFLLNARLTYTFRAGRGDDAHVLPRGYTDYEEELTPSDSGNVLIIDDILGVGSVLGGVIESLRKRPKPPEDIRVLTIYSLGDVKELAGALAGIKVDYLASFPDVRYEKEDPETRMCSECKDRPEIVIPEE